MGEVCAFLQGIQVVHGGVARPERPGLGAETTGLMGPRRVGLHWVLSSHACCGLPPHGLVNICIYPLDIGSHYVPMI